MPRAEGLRGGKPLAVPWECKEAEAELTESGSREGVRVNRGIGASGQRKAPRLSEGWQKWVSVR